jgi:hypothetical protein
MWGMRLKERKRREDGMFAPKLKDQDARACFLMQWPVDATELATTSRPQMPHRQIALHEMTNFDAIFESTTTPDKQYPNTASKMCFLENSSNKSYHDRLSRDHRMSCRVTFAIERFTATLLPNREPMATEYIIRGIFQLEKKIQDFSRMTSTHPSLLKSHT